MKKSDIMTLILIASLSVVVAYFVADAVFKNIAPQEVKVKTIEKIDSGVVEPDPSIFNKDSINPTVEVKIGSSEE